jgi:MoxR-like ATPase
VTASDPRGRIAEQIVGRERELELILAAVATGRDIMLEGPPGTSKTTILRAITAEWGIPLVFAEGNAELTPGRLLGHHDPARVMSEGFTRDTFEAGPLVEAMTDGGFLYIEEFNRAPEDTLNALLTAIADREISVPRFGTVEAEPTFRVIGSMNPYDNVGTTRLSTSIKDRLCRLEVGYQDELSEREIVTRRGGAERDDELAERLVCDAVAVVRMTRAHEAVRQGSSVRGAIDTFVLARELMAMRGIDDSQDGRYAATFFDAMTVALSGRLVMDEAAEVDVMSVLHEIWQRRFVLDPAIAAPG